MTWKYEISELKEQWEKVTTAIENLYNELDELEERLDNLEQDYVGDKESAEWDCALGLIKQCHSTINHLEEITKERELRHEIDYEKSKEIITSCETYEEFVSGVRKKVLGF